MTNCKGDSPWVESYPKAAAKPATTEKESERWRREVTPAHFGSDIPVHMALSIPALFIYTLPVHFAQRSVSCQVLRDRVCHLTN